MLAIHKILFPIVFTDSSTHIARQVGWLARRFNAEVILLHVVTPFSYPSGVVEKGHEITLHDLHSRIVQQAEKDLDQALLPELEGIRVTRMLLRGDPAREIVQVARDKSADLIVMSTHGDAILYRFLLGSVTAKVLHSTPCPVWTGAHLEKEPARSFSLQNILCSVDLSAHSRHTVAIASELAAAVDARLTLVHVTESVESFGPGGSYVNNNWKELIVGHAKKTIAQIQADAGTNAEVVIHSGRVTDLLNQAAAQTNADLLVTGHSPIRSHLGANGNGYGIICASVIPVLSV
jgi:nucleotide-binding universal stress UspA family protein